MIRTAVFDLDGTLVDSFQQITEATNIARREFGFAEIDDTISRQVIGLPAEELFRELGDTRTTKALVDRFRAILYESTHSGNKVYEGVLPYLEALKNAGHRIGVATSKPQSLAESVVSNSGLAPLVDIVSGIDGCAPKPDPAVVLRVLRTTNSDFGVMFGDRPEDVLAAKHAGIPSIGIAQTAFTKAELKSVGATVCFENFSDLIATRPDVFSDLTNSIGNIKCQ